ncbi:hypothetical protein [Hydrogenimonas sp.]|jgi:hypothetical protein|uniref:hypothetical protein n=1 Tax=Hydrogenimonas sp. TaxID=2231112 RepID=UPI0026362A38|nr:hypothetical protein [Hydrogenimonas sp.]
MKDNEPNITLRPDTYENLLDYAKILGLPPEMIVEQALEAFFAEVNRQLQSRNEMDDNAQTNLSYDEFWDGVDL